MPIDLHAHWIPPSLVDALRARTVFPRLRRGGDGQDYFDCANVSLPMLEGFDDLPARLAKMDKHGVTRAVLSLSTFYGIECLPLAESIRLCRIFNDELAAACSAQPSRFSALAALPVADLGATLAEFQRAMTLPGFVGALLPGDGFLSKRRAERFRPLFEVANRRKALLLVHYGPLTDDLDAPRVDTSDHPDERVNTLDIQARISSNMITLCFTDFLDAYPDATVLCHNLGGNIPFEVERLDHLSLKDHPGAELPSRRVRAARVLVDCNSLGARSIERAVEIYGAEKIVLGTDGTDFGMGWSREALAEARITDAQRRAILDDNAARVLERVTRA
jgi:predicted TIM-barrel fold metal-dependent hydrolase